MTFSLPYKKIHLFIPYNGKIADITEDDTDKHYLNLATALTETRKIIAVWLMANRVTGTGDLYGYPNEGTKAIWVYEDSYGIALCFIIADGTNRLQYALNVANDDYDVYCLGYVVEV